VVGIRILGVLQRIALCYFFASVIVYYLKVRGAFLVGLILLLLYWLLCYTLGDGADPYSMLGYFGNVVDKAVLHEPHMYHGEGLAFDPEGLASTLPAIVQVIFGYLVGDYILKRSKLVMAAENPAANQAISPLYQTLTGLFIAAVALLLAGYTWGLTFPVNKKIWTSSYVLVTTGLAIAILATLVYFIEIKGVRAWWTRFFERMRFLYLR
jgi:predicted acyltransferase